MEPAALPNLLDPLNCLCCCVRRVIVLLKDPRFVIEVFICTLEQVGLDDLDVFRSIQTSVEDCPRKHPRFVMAAQTLMEPPPWLAVGCVRRSLKGYPTGRITYFLLPVERRLNAVSSENTIECHCSCVKWRHSCACSSRALRCLRLR